MQRRRNWHPTIDECIFEDIDVGVQTEKREDDYLRGSIEVRTDYGDLSDHSDAAMQTDCHVEVAFGCARDIEVRERGVQACFAGVDSGVQTERRDPSARRDGEAQTGEGEAVLRIDGVAAPAVSSGGYLDAIWDSYWRDALRESVDPGAVHPKAADLALGVCEDLVDVNDGCVGRDDFADLLLGTVADALAHWRELGVLQVAGGRLRMAEA